MDSNIPSARVAADVKIVAQKSQAAPLFLLGISCICLVSGFIFLWHQPNKSWVGFLFSLIFLATGLASWWRSHRSSDFDNGSPTVITNEKTGVSLTADPRLIDCQSSAELLGKLITEIAHRKPLPEPDGMVMNDGAPDPERKQDAHEIVERANQEALEATKKLQGIKTPSPPSETISDKELNLISGDPNKSAAPR